MGRSEIFIIYGGELIIEKIKSKRSAEICAHGDSDGTNADRTCATHVAVGVVCWVVSCIAFSVFAYILSPLNFISVS